jgi:hypothetical protein
MGFISLSYSCSTQGSFYSRTTDQGNVDIQVFYDQLSPYGQWIDYPEYGYVWLPDVGPGFSPYETNGYWVMTDYGWTWVSDYSWGWAAFHYGRWDLDGRLGWFWIPDTQWGPAWVVWRRANGYYGWAPMGPRMHVGYYDSYGDINYWHFVRERDFGRPHISRYMVGRRDYDRLLRNSSVINNTYVDRRRSTTYVAGPSRDEVQRVTGRRINSLAVRDNNRPGTVIGKDQVRIFRPQVEKSTRSAAPTRVESRDQVNPQRRRSQDNIYLPNERRNEKMQQMERQSQPNANPNMNRRQQRLEERRMNIPQNGQDKAPSKPFGQEKREKFRGERQHQVEQTQPQQSQPQVEPQQSQPDQSGNQNSGRRR